MFTAINATIIRPTGFCSRLEAGVSRRLNSSAALNARINGASIERLVFLINFKQKFIQMFKLDFLNSVLMIKQRKILISTDNAATTKFLKFFTLEPDDSLALAVLLDAHKKGRLKIIGITSTFGNTDGNTSYQITKKQIKFSGLNIPVIKGAINSGQNNSKAADFIANKIRESKEKIILVGLGPVTDFAAVFRKYPELKENVDFFIVRSGPYLVKKYWYLFSFNAFKDIESAKFIFQLGGNKFSIGKEIFSITIKNEVVEEIQKIKHSMMKYIARDLKKWNLQNKIFPIKGYFSRKGNMCPWDLIWVMYLVEPNLFKVVKENNHCSLNIKSREIFLESIIKRLKNWDNPK